jgi:hypothetical protein
MDKRPDPYARLGALVRQAREDARLTQTQLSELMSARLGEKFAQSLVAANEQGAGWGGRDGRLPAAYADVLNIPRVEVQRALDLAADDAGEPVTFADMVRNDPSLDDSSKHHLINQYGLLRAASAHNRAKPSSLSQTGRPSRNEIEAMDLPRWAKDVLLAELEAAEDGDDEERPMSRVVNI